MLLSRQASLIVNSFFVGLYVAIRFQCKNKSQLSHNPEKTQVFQIVIFLHSFSAFAVSFVIFLIWLIGRE